MGTLLGFFLPFLLEVLLVPWHQVGLAIPTVVINVVSVTGFTTQQKLYTFSPREPFGPSSPVGPGGPCGGWKYITHFEKCLLSSVSDVQEIQGLLVVQMDRVLRLGPALLGCLGHHLHHHCHPHPGTSAWRSGRGTSTVKVPLNWTL